MRMRDDTSGATGAEQMYTAKRLMGMAIESKANRNYQLSNALRLRAMRFNFSAARTLRRSGEPLYLEALWRGAEIAFEFGRFSTVRRAYLAAQRAGLDDRTEGWADRFRQLHARSLATAEEFARLASASLHPMQQSSPSNFTGQYRET